MSGVLIELIFSSEYNLLSILESLLAKPKKSAIRLDILKLIGKFIQQVGDRIKHFAEPILVRISLN